MPLRNRVTPFGDLIAVAGRGLVYGNRGCLHDAKGEIRRAYAGRRWIACRLSFRGWHRTPLLQPGRFTELFFLDEATAWAAGHRPCALCRRADYDRFTELWANFHPAQRGADAIDEQLHRERLDGSIRRRHRRPVADLPDATMVAVGDEAWLVLGKLLHRWTPDGYAETRPRHELEVAEVLTPPSLVAVLAVGWEPDVALLHPSAVSERSPRRN